MESINNILYLEAKVQKKKVQIVSQNGKTATLDFASLNEIKQILDYIYDDPHCESYWNAVHEKLKNPII